MSVFLLSQHNNDIFFNRFQRLPLFFRELGPSASPLQVPLHNIWNADFPIARKNMREEGNCQGVEGWSTQTKKKIRTSQTG